MNELRPIVSVESVSNDSSEMSVSDKLGSVSMCSFQQHQSPSDDSHLYRVVLRLRVQCESNCAARNVGQDALSDAIDSVS